MSLHHIQQLRELGRKFRSLYEEKKKECEDTVSQKEETEKLLEELKEANTKASTEDVSAELRQQSELVKQV